MNLTWLVLLAALLGSGAPSKAPTVNGDTLSQGTRDAPDARCPFTTPGLVVETVSPESAAFRAGLMPGDRLFSWCRIPAGRGACVARGELRTPFEWFDLEKEDMQRGGVVVAGARGAASSHWNLLPMFQGITVAPLLYGPFASAYQRSRDREQAGDPVTAAQELEQAAEQASGNHCAGVELWFRDQAALLRVRAHQWPEVDTAYKSAMAKAQALGATRVEEWLQLNWAETFVLRGDVTEARRQLEKVLGLEEKNSPEKLLVVLVLIRLARLAEWRDDLDEALRLSQRAYDLARQVAPGSGAEAATANNLAAVTATRGDLARAELHLARTLAIVEKLQPAGEAILMNLWNYGELLLSRGDFAGAEAALLRAKRIAEKILPESRQLAIALHLLGEIAEQRGDYEAAESLFQRQLGLFEKLDPTDSILRERLRDLGRLTLLQHNGVRAEEVWQRALEISDKLNPKGLKTASCLIGLAEAVRLQGRVSEAQQLLQRALAIWQELYPEAVDAGSIHLKLGILLLEQGDAGAAEAHLRAAIHIYEKYRGSLAESYQALARLQARRGEAEEAATTYQAAIDSLEAQGRRLGGAKESQWLYGSTLGDLYFEAAEHQIALGRPQEAWRLIERGRARGFQEQLTQRDLRFSGELPADLYAERHRLDAEYDRVQRTLADWEPQQGAGKLAELEGRLRDLRLAQAEVQERIERSSPRLAALERPTFLDLPAARSALDPGTVLLTYAVGEQRSFLFVIEAPGTPGPGFSFYPLAIGKEDLRKEVEAFLSLVGRPESLFSEVQQSGRHLYDLLVRPAEPVLARADRWLISPDGPLQALPFAALVAGDRYVAESKPMDIVASAAVYKEIKATRRDKPRMATTEMLAVGDPLYPAGLKRQAETATDPQVQTALRRGLKLERLPATRSEVETISALFPGSRVLLGRDATEEAVKSLAPHAWRLHFACHGLLDERFPLNSALALSIPERPQEGRDNGLLQAWEIFEELRLDADLVTLSACDSGLGKELGGEGLVGLARAFQFAGARSVLASLWSVSDVSTARLMKRFYTYLRQGKTKDEALRSAQLDLIRSQKGKLSHPYHWAGFALYGDWK
jgi:CHAT domain-containing protein/tetratricopeptide (TPR) repeat protein